MRRSAGFGRRVSWLRRYSASPKYHHGDRYYEQGDYESAARLPRDHHGDEIARQQSKHTHNYQIAKRRRAKSRKRSNRSSSKRQGREEGWSRQSGIEQDQTNLRKK